MASPNRPSPTLGAIALALALASAGAAAEGPRASLALVDEMIAAHGGMDAWAQAPTVSWTDVFRPPSAPPEQAPAMSVVVEQGPRRAYIDVVGTGMRLAWDGEQAWSEGWQIPIPPRFLALLNYHFLNLPWLAKDPGVQLGPVGRSTLWAGPDRETEYLMMKITYGEGVGDTPDDYYVLFIDPETKRLVANEYIVTYRGILPEGVEATPPHLLVYDAWGEVGGLTVPTHYTIYDRPKPEAPEEDVVLYLCDARDWSFSEPFDEQRMTMPEGGVVDGSQP